MRLQLSLCSSSRGDEGADRLYGGNGDDTFTGGLGNDILYGQNGDDTFLYVNDGSFDRRSLPPPECWHAGGD